MVVDDREGAAGGCVTDDRRPRFCSALLPALSLPLSPGCVCFSASGPSFFDAGRSSSDIRVSGLRSAAACTAAEGSLIASALFSCTVSNIDFPLGPRDGAFGGGCSCCSVLFDSSIPGFGGGVEFPGDGADTLILGAAPALLCSAFFGSAIAEPFLALVADGGGDFNRGDKGHCGVVSPDPTPPALLLALGSLETASVTGPDDCKDGTFAADNALCIAAAEGCVDICAASDCGRLSLRIGELFRDVCGLFPAEGDKEARLLERCFRNCGTGVVCPDVDADEACRCWLGLLLLL